MVYQIEHSMNAEEFRSFEPRMLHGKATQQQQHHQQHHHPSISINNPTTPPTPPPVWVHSTNKWISTRIHSLVLA